MRLHFRTAQRSSCYRAVRGRRLCCSLTSWLNLGMSANERGCQLDRIAEGWAINRPTARGAVRKALQAAFAMLLEQPSLCMAVVEASTPGERRFDVERIRYGVYDCVRESRLEVCLRGT